MSKSFKQLVQGILNYGKNRNYKVFLVFFTMSTFFWFLIKFSKLYSVTKEFPIMYTSLPQYLSYGDVEENSISLEITSSGFQLLNYSLFGKTINIDLSKIRRSSGNQYYIIPDDQISLIKQQFPVGTGVFVNRPDTMFFDFSRRLEKKVKVKLVKDIEFAKSFKLKDAIRVIPDSIIVSGPSSVIADIEFVETDPLDIKDLGKDLERNIRIKKNEDTRIVFTPKVVKVIVDVEKFTQNTLSVPVVLENVPQGFLLKTFPDNVKITFNVGLSDYKSIGKTSFEVIADYNQLKEKDQQTIPLKINVLNEGIDLISVDPVNVEFLLRKIE